MKKITVKDILERKEIVEKLPKNFKSETFNAEFEVRDDVSKDSIIEIMKEEEGQYRQYLKLVYLCCPFFKSEELRKNFEVKEPYDLVDKVFSGATKEVIDFGNFILQKYGFLSKEALDKIKKQ